MARKSFADVNCSVAQALEALGDWWTLLIIREAFVGTRRFADFEANLGIAKNVLAKRLNHLVEHEIMTKVDAGRHGSRYEYALTPKGRDLLTVMTALREWGDRWIFGEGNEPFIVRDRRTYKRVPRLRLLDEHGQPLRGRDILMEPGPGATAETLRRFGLLDDDTPDADARPRPRAEEEVP